ncbi:hypothetical protein [Acidiferrobacter sp.]|uniref:FitA-like ribbon-helix-helix domain-containing protein n=1 Tax=Acidiferrobacter sp. TaxID=1872107 RepID=UPI0026392FF7|nr:hypothetical protein [Acidiferrobacter sp.]
MANLTLREVPESLHGWLKQQATRHRGSVNKEVLELLEGLQRGTTTAAPKDPEIKPAPPPGYRPTVCDVAGSR